MFLLEFDTVSGHLDFKQSTVLPTDFYSAVAIVVLTNPDRIVVAADFGVWWSPVPQPASNPAGYVWQQAQGLPPQNYTGRPPVQREASR